MSRISQGTVIFLSGLVLLTTVAFGLFTRYVKPSFGPVLVVTGVLLVGLALLTLLTGSPEQTHGHAPGDDAGEGVAAASASDHGEACAHSDGPRVGWLLLAPITVMTLIVPPALGADAAQRQDDTARRPIPTAKSYLPVLPAEDPARIDMAVFTMHATTDGGATLAGKRFTILGFVTPAEDGGWYLTRMVMQCCAADAFAFKAKINGVAPPPTNSWVEVTGTMANAGSYTDLTTLPVIQAETVKPATAPNPPYL